MVFSTLGREPSRRTIDSPPSFRPAQLASWLRHSAVRFSLFNAAFSPLHHWSLENTWERNFGKIPIFLFLRSLNPEYFLLYSSIFGKKNCQILFLSKEALDLKLHETNFSGRYSSSRRAVRYGAEKRSEAYHVRISDSFIHSPWSLVTEKKEEEEELISE